MAYTLLAILIQVLSVKVAKIANPLQRCGMGAGAYPHSGWAGPAGPVQGVLRSGGHHEG